MKSEGECVKVRTVSINEMKEAYESHSVSALEQNTVLIAITDMCCVYVYAWSPRSVDSNPGERMRRHP
jgi:hypothetical protein